MLSGERIFLRKFKLTDAPVLLKWGRQPRYHKLAGFEQYRTLAAAQKGAQEYSKRPNSFALCLKQNQKVIGIVELYERGMDERSGLLKTKEIGFLLDQKYEGQGYMTEALRLVIQLAFTKMRQLEIWAGVFTGNKRSAQLLQRLGFKYVYTADYAQISQLFTFKEKYYLLKREEWLKMKLNTKS